MLTCVFAEILNHESFAGPMNKGCYQMQVYPLHVTSNFTAETEVKPEETSIQTDMNGEHKTMSQNYGKQKRRIPSHNSGNDTSIQQLKRRRTSVSSSTTHVFHNNKQKQGIIHFIAAQFTVYHNFQKSLRLTFDSTDSFTHQSVTGPTDEGCSQMQQYPLHLPTNLLSETQRMPEQPNIENQIKHKYEATSANCRKHKKKIPHVNQSDDTPVQQLKRQRANATSSMSSTETANEGIAIKKASKIGHLNLL